MLKKIVTGGQTGVDRAALDVAIMLGIPHGGWCPLGRKAEDGVLETKYQLQETMTTEYAERTRLNIRDSDATLIIVASLPLNVQDGTNLTIEEAIKTNKPYLIFDLSKTHTMHSIINWLNQYQVKILNIAGPRESSSRGIYQKSFIFLIDLLKSCYSF